MPNHNDSGSPSPAHDPASPFKLLLTPAKAALPAGEPHTLRLLVRIHAPDVPAGVAAGATRTPLHLALVLDRSGSMNGQPLDEAKRCARLIVDSLGPSDRAAIFAFDDEVDCVAPLTPASQKLTLAAALATIDTGGNTNLHGGWRAGAEELLAKLASEDIHRVILLSDGCANRGETELEAITAACRSFAKRGVSTSTYGLGRSFNESLMLAMASAGHGSAYYGQTAADLAEPFAAEFALLSSLAARKLVLKVKAPDGVAVRLRNDYEAVEGEPFTWKLPDLPFAAEAWCLLEVDLPPAMGDSVGFPLTVTVQASAQDSSPLFLIAGMTSLPLIERSAWDALPVDPTLARRAIELDAADALLAVRTAVAADDWTGARALVEDAAKRFAGHSWAIAVLDTMRRLIATRDKPLASKEALYARHRMQSRLSVREEDTFDATGDIDIPLFLRRKGEQGKGDRGPGGTFRGDGGDGKHGA